MKRESVASELGIFARVIRADCGDLSRRLARFILTLGFESQDQARMEDLAGRNQQGRLSAHEKIELMNFIKASHLLALLHSKARQSLKRKKAL